MSSILIALNVLSPNFSAIESGTCFITVLESLCVFATCLNAGDDSNSFPFDVPKKAFMFAAESAPLPLNIPFNFDLVTPASTNAIHCKLLLALLVLVDTFIGIPKCLKIIALTIASLASCVGF